MTVTNIPRLSGWMALPEAAEELGLTRQGLHYRVNTGQIARKFVRAVSTGSRELVLISIRYIDEQKEAAAE